MNSGVETSYKAFSHVGLAVDPIHVGTGGSHLGSVDNTIVRDPVTKIPKIPGSGLAGVIRSYVAMAKGKYPGCAGQGQSKPDGTVGHCGKPNCPICTVFGFARGNQGGFAGLAAFSDAQVLLFPVASREGPIWVTAPEALRQIDGLEALEDLPDTGIAYRAPSNSKGRQMNLGWLSLEMRTDWDQITEIIECLKTHGIPGYITSRLVVSSDKLFSHIVNSNLEVRTSVAINPVTGAAEEGALFTYEALPRGTVLYWEITCQDPKYFQIAGQPIAFNDQGNKASIDNIHSIVSLSFPYLEHLGIGAMGTRGMGRLRVLSKASEQGALTAGNDSSEEGDR